MSVCEVPVAPQVFHMISTEPSGCRAETSRRSLQVAANGMVCDGTSRNAEPTPRILAQAPPLRRRAGMAGTGNVTSHTLQRAQTRPVTVERHFTHGDAGRA